MCAGVAKQATLHSVKVMDDGGSGTYSNIIAGMNWVRNHVQSNGWRGVVNLSLGGPTSPALNDATAQLIAAGIPVASRAGNSYGADSCSQSPASTPGAMAAAASTITDGLASYRRARVSVGVPVGAAGMPDCLPSILSSTVTLLEAHPSSSNSLLLYMQQRRVVRGHLCPGVLHPQLRHRLRLR